MKQWPSVITAVAFAAAPASAGPPPFAAQPISDAELAATTGGFKTPVGIDVNFAVEINTRIDGQLALRSVLKPGIEPVTVYVPPVAPPVVNVPPVDVAPVVVPPVNVAPVNVAPVNVPPVDVAPVDVPPVHVAPVDVRPVDVAPVNVGPVEVAPVDVKPVAVPPVSVPPVTVPPINIASPPAPASPSSPGTPMVPLPPAPVLDTAFNPPAIQHALPAINVTVGALGSAATEIGTVGVTEQVVLPVADAAIAPVESAFGSVTVEPSRTGPQVLLAGPDIEVRHMLGQATTVIANIANDRVIDTTTVVHLDLPNVQGLALGAALSRIDDAIRRD